MPWNGLTAIEAARRLAVDGLNELPQERRRSIGRIAADALREPMLQLLLAAGALYLVLGDVAEALILLAFALLNVVMVILQENRSEKALAALRDLSGIPAMVIRDGVRRKLDARQLVRGDLIFLVEGNRVPADAMVIDTAGLQIDESVLTGESVPVLKAAGGDEAIRSGCLVLAGTGFAEVTATGSRSEIGRIGKSLADLESAPTPLQRQTRALVRVFAVAGVACSLLLAAAYGLIHHDWTAAILAGITLAMATLPQEFPLVLTIFVVLGAWRMAQRKVLTRRPAAVEALGAATVLCTDKTGTLTLNRMQIAILCAGGDELSLSGAAPDALPERFHELVEFAILASRPDPFDPMEQAFLALGAATLTRTGHLHHDWSLVRDYPLSPALMAMSQLWQPAAGAPWIIASKGAPETVGDLCHLPPEEMAALRRDAATLAARGLRVLAVAKGSAAGGRMPERQHDIDFVLIGLIGLADPLRPGAAEAVSACREAGIRVVMITGDHPVTAQAIARQAGIPADPVMTGDELAALDESAARDRVRRTCVFARITPDQKLRLVQILAGDGEVVAMTGDGVNDAPALKAAHIGVAMGGRGTDVARESAAVVLLDDDFTSLAAGVRCGRRIDDNLRKAFGYILAVHVPIAGLSLIPVLLGWPILLGPIHVVFLELIIDPVSSIVFEAEREEPDIMKRPPRRPGAPLLDRWSIGRSLLQGGTVFAAALFVLVAGVKGGIGDASRSMAFLTMVLGNFGLILGNRSLSGMALRGGLRPNRALVTVAAITAIGLGLAFSTAPLRSLFGFVPLDPPRWLFAAGAAIASLAVNEGIGALGAGLTRIKERFPPRPETARSHLPHTR
jgi:Ca2+-transporting ATPase